MNDISSNSKTFHGGNDEHEGATATAESFGTFRPNSSRRWASWERAVEWWLRGWCWPVERLVFVRIWRVNVLNEAWACGRHARSHYKTEGRCCAWERANNTPAAAALESGADLHQSWGTLLLLIKTTTATPPQRNEVIATRHLRPICSSRAARCCAIVPGTITTADANCPLVWLSSRQVRRKNKLSQFANVFCDFFKGKTLLP